MKIPLSALRAAFWGACLAVVVLALLPAEQVQRLPLNFWDKAQHALAFGVLALLGLRAWPSARHHPLVLVALLVLGGGIEVAQHLLGWRHGEWADWGADALGVAVASLWALVRRRRA